MEFKNGFTLAEVLITLVIIGVIAAMTIPTLINKTNEQETVTAVKKAYSVLGQAYQKVIAENGEIIPAEHGANDTEASKNMGEMFAKHLSTEKVCGTSGNSDCFGDGMYKKFDGSDFVNWNIVNWPDYKMRLNDGMSVAVRSYLVYNNGNNSQNVIGYVHVDVNGNKGPNIYGKDTFRFYITKYAIIPFGTPNYPFSLSSCRQDGSACAAWVIAKGNMDYLRKDVSW